MKNMWKKLQAALLLLVMAFAFAACGQDAEAPESGFEEETEATLEAEVTENAGDAVEAQDASIYDPTSGWIEAGTAAEAAAGAGIEDFEVPDQIDVKALSMSGPQFSCLDGVAQAYYEAAAACVYIRKAEGVYGAEITERDVKGFPCKWQQSVDDEGETDADDMVDCYGMKEGEAIVVQWTDGDETFAITSQGLGGEEFTMDEKSIRTIVDAVD